MASDAAWEVAEAIDDLIRFRVEVPSIYYRHQEDTRDELRSELAESIDDLLKNLLVARVDQYTVK